LRFTSGYIPNQQQQQGFVNQGYNTLNNGYNQFQQQQQGTAVTVRKEWENLKL
jgi:hypothetical protein